MANFLLVYKGGSMAETEAAQKAAMEAWGGWFGKLGDAVVDGGNPTSESATVSSNGSVKEGAASALTGYTVLKADTMDAATTMAQGCPVLTSGGSVEVYQTFNAM